MMKMNNTLRKSLQTTSTSPCRRYMLLTSSVLSATSKRCFELTSSVLSATSKRCFELTSSVLSATSKRCFELTSSVLSATSKQCFEQPAASFLQILVGTRFNSCDNVKIVRAFYIEYTWEWSLLPFPYLIEKEELNATLYKRRLARIGCRNHYA
ncbi:S1 RNA-binding domain-containing protein [Streptococcus pneumoniae]|nr:S1 RNA-binding domain-containing protein [Streptococcus pneumoniae]VJT31735.1 S1 RNA-binding domain-containing protein [Streptococcus pneumoniae]VKX73551.1 S1 RNA-binding domain-containing protein [Streptococcus pneumoniae]